MRALRSRAFQSDSETSETKTEEPEYTEENVSKKVKRKKLKKRHSDENGQDLNMAQELVVKKKKIKKSRKQIAEIIDSSMIQENETATEVLSTSTESHKSENIATKKKTKKSKKRSAEILDSSTIQANETATTVLSTSTESQISENKDEKVARKKKVRKPKEDFAEIQDSSMIQANETATKVLSTSTESHESENKDKNIATKKKTKKSKKRSAEILDSSTIQANETATKVLRTSTESQISENKDEKVARKKKIRKPKEVFAEIQDSSMIQANETTTTLLSTSTASHKSENKDETISVKKKIRKARDFLRSTILNSPNFDNIITSTAVKPKRPKMGLEDSENVEMENTSLIKLKKIKKAQEQKKRMSKIEDSNKFNPRVTFSVSRNNSLNDTNNSIVQTINKTKSKRNTLSSSISLNKTSNQSLKINSPDKLNESIKTKKNIKKRSTGESSIGDNRDSVSNRRDTFCKPSKVSNITNNVIAISDSPEISKLTNTFNKSNTVGPELSSDEEMETDDDSLKSFKQEENKVLFVENTVITISDTPDRTTVKQNTFNKLVSPEVTSDEDEEINDQQNKSLGINQSLNCTKSKSNLSEENNDSFNRNDIDCKTLENISPKSKNIIDETFDEFNDLSDVGKSIFGDIIDISDTSDLFNIKQNTSNLSANTTITKSERIINTSGDWHVENSTNIEDVETNLNSTFDVETNLNSTFEIENKENNVSLSRKDKTIRKKWLKFPRYSLDANLVLKQISSSKLRKKMNASKIVQQIMNAPTDLFELQKPTIAPSNLSTQKTNLPVQKINFSSKKSSVRTPSRKSPLKSIKKSVISASSSKNSASKRTALPNFAHIHQKAFKKMENLWEHSDRKKQRAQMLLTSNNPDSKHKSSSSFKPKSEENKLKFSRKLFTSELGDTRFNRFGFKTVEQKKPMNFVANTNVAIEKPVVKQSVFARSDVVAIANKNKVVTKKRDDRRDAMKGVRTNRRFELLMQMRNK